MASLKSTFDSYVMNHSSLLGKLVCTSDSRGLSVLREIVLLQF